MQATGGADGVVTKAVDLLNVQAPPIKPPGNRLPATPTQIEGQGDHRSFFRHDTLLAYDGPH
jgi:hypothetical protein